MKTLGNRHCLRVALIAGVALLALTATALAQGRRGGGDPFAGQPRSRVLVITGGCCHDYVNQTRLLMDAVNKALPVDWTVVMEGGRGMTAPQRVYDNPNWSAGYDLVIHNECFANSRDEALLRRIADGHRRVPAVVAHCAMHTYRAAPAADLWREFLGVTTVRHTAEHAIRTSVAPEGQELLAGFPVGWVTPVDELYVIDRFWPNARPLLTAVSPEDQKTYPLAWTNSYGGTRVFGTTIGHGDATWGDAAFQDLMVRGIRWALGR